MQKGKRYKKGQLVKLLDGRVVTILSTFGKAYWIAEGAGKISVVYPSEIKYGVDRLNDS